VLGGVKVTGCRAGPPGARRRRFSGAELRGRVQPAGGLVVLGARPGAGGFFSSAGSDPTAGAPPTGPTYRPCSQSPPASLPTMPLPPSWPHDPAGRPPSSPGPWLVGPLPRPGPWGRGGGRPPSSPDEAPLEGLQAGHEDSWEPLRPLPRSISPAERALWVGLVAAAAVDLGIPLLLQGPVPGLPGWIRRYLQAMHNTGWRSTFAAMAALSALRGAP
jgi:hypothetical protein